jgi:hypothetical protein
VVLRLVEDNCVTRLGYVRGGHIGSRRDTWPNGRLRSEHLSCIRGGHLVGKTLFR